MIPHSAFPIKMKFNELKKQVGFHLSHNSSISVLSEDGAIELFLEEERLSRLKHDSDPVNVCNMVLGGLTMDEIEKYEISTSSLISKDKHGASTLDRSSDLLSMYISKSLKLPPHEQNTFKYHIIQEKFEKFFDHHLFHAYCGFYNSGFDDAVVVVVDGMGNFTSPAEDSHEVVSIFDASYPFNMNLLQGMSTPSYHSCDESEHKGEWTCGIGMAYSAVSSYMGFGGLGSGKVMGLSSYGKEDPNIRSFLADGFNVDSNLFYRTKYGCNFIPYDYLPHHKEAVNTKDHFEKLANLAWRLQEDFQTHMLQILLNALSVSKCKNIILTGGCALNCSANYWYLDKLPKDVKLYVEPISNDAGTSIGVSKAQHYCKTGSIKKHPLKTLYLAPE
jgi:carbamoyltransferase